MRSPGGWLCVAVEDGSVQEHDTYTCAHCNTIVVVQPREVPGGWCRMCSRMVCDRCADGGCSPFEKKLEAQEARYHALRSYGV